MASTALRISIAGKCGSSYKEPFFAGNSRSTLSNSFRPLQPPPRPAVLCFSSHRRERDIPSVSSKIIKRKASKEENVGEDGSAADSLFRKLREVLKNVDDDISGEELEKLEQELGEALTDEELFGALESLADGETEDEVEEEGDDDGKVDIDGEDGGGVDGISEVEEEIAKLVQELSDVLEDDKFVEVMEYVARGEIEDEENDDVEEDEEVVVEEEEEEDGDSDYEVEVVEIEMDGDENEEEKDNDDTDYEVKVVEVEMNDDKDEHNEVDEEEDDGDDDDDYEAKVVDVEIDEEEEEDGDDEDDISKLTELVEKLSTALEDEDILTKFQ